MIIRFELNGKAFNAAMPAPIRKEERVEVDGEQYGASEIIWQLQNDDDGSRFGYGLDERKWDQYVVLVKYHVRSVRGDYDSPLVPEPRHVFR